MGHCKMMNRVVLLFKEPGLLKHDALRPSQQEKELVYLEYLHFVHSVFQAMGPSLFWPRHNHYTGAVPGGREYT